MDASAGAGAAPPSRAKLREEKEPEYKKIGSVDCPYFKNEKVSFDASGLNHLKFKSQRVPRLRKDKFMRLKLIMHAPEVLKKSGTLQEFKQQNEMIKVKINKREESVSKSVKYYGFVSIIENNFKKRLKIIVREVDGGEKHFWSIIPQ